MIFGNEVTQKIRFSITTKASSKASAIIDDDPWADCRSIQFKIQSKVVGQLVDYVFDAAYSIEYKL